MIHDLKTIMLASDDRIQNAMQILTDFNSKVVLIIDGNKCLIGTVTDGDIRRGLLRGFSINEPLTKIMNTKPVCAISSMTKIEMQTRMKRLGIPAIPIVDVAKRVLGIEILNEGQGVQKNHIPILIMAGGFGKRLGKLTKDLPKPMLKIGDKPILENIIDKLIDQGFHKFFISTHYKADKIIEHFKDGSEKGVTIEYIKEAKPLGTAGALSLLKGRVDGLLVVLNGDLLIDFDVNLLVQYHVNNNAGVTVCVKKENFCVPYGVVYTEGEKIRKIVEKPTYPYITNSGVYCFSSYLLERIQAQQPIDMPDLVNLVVEQDDKVMPFFLHEEWIDIGCKDNLEKAIKKQINIQQKETVVL